MMGDGKKSYDHDHDNQEHELAACSVSCTTTELYEARVTDPTVLIDGLPQARCPDIVQAAVHRREIAQSGNAS